MSHAGRTVCLHNTAARAVVPVELDPSRPVRVYTCGPTVYRPVHLGNLRSYLLADSLRRLLLAMGYEVKHVKNITDVGHMRQEMLDRGEDKVIAEALRAGVTPAEIAAGYTEAFYRDEQRLNILRADVFPRASDHVERMVEITRALVERGFGYVRNGNVYFRVGRFGGYGELGGALSREGLRQGVRAEADPLKDDPRDFAVWKQAEPGRTALVWPSPWGPGFPGWHIECTAMATQHLGQQVDIHTGGVDNIFPHHEDERAQSEAYTGVAPFARVWLHGQHLLADGIKMAKSSGNAYTLDDLLALNFNPLAFRYLCLTAHYRARLNFTFTSLRAAQTGLRRLRSHTSRWQATLESDNLSHEARACRDAFWDAAANDLALPRCLALVWSLVRGPWRSLPEHDKAVLVRDFDRLLGLDLAHPPERRTADPFRGALSSPSTVAYQSGLPDRCEVSVNLLVQPDEDLQAVERCVFSLLRHASTTDLEVVLVDATGSPAAHARLTASLRGVDAGRLRLVWLDHDPGAGGGRNAGLRASRGRVIVLADASVEFCGDALSPLVSALDDPSVGAVGPFGLVTADFRHFYELPEAPSEHPWPREVDALQNYLLAFRRADLPRIGWLDERFRFYRILDLDLSCAIRTRVGRVVTLGGLPLVRHSHAVWEALAEGDREERSRKNFGRFLKRWDHHPGLQHPASAREAHALEALEHAHASVHG